MSIAQEIELYNQAYSLQALKEKARQKDPNREVTHLKLFLNYYSPLLKQLSTLHSSFPRLLVLNLSYNNLQSLEPLQKIPLTHLQELHLFQNDISSVKPLRKCNLPNLELLSVVSNRLLDLDKLWETNLPSLRQLLAYDNDMSWVVTSIVRLNSHRLKHIILKETLGQGKLAQDCYMARFPRYNPF